ncbi:pollen-specific leucine-rich repeat extensin-like protein 1 [Aquila chrysaetos chrysaetos]|uniref:Pollen-specific leucine-rich repeat extensin-like protein 1 n=1 Tax=Aquila chrysaetos chrysaetos TaxID=223781 RepID=A0A663EX48_AQUCH|nr:pollen-specific leucine-rich repeat extensin-like protein 1 [Aquila chrysaetos chrysaetos]
METSYTSEMTMLITVSSSVQPAPIHHHLSPPPTLPKPGKDNLRLQRLLKKAAKKNAILASEQAKSFRSSLSPVNEASPDLEHNESTPPAETPETTAAASASLPTHLSIKPITHRISSPFRKSKPFTLKVTEQRRIAEHLMLTTSPAMPLLHKPGAPKTLQQPEGTDTHLPSPHDPSISVFPQPPPSSTPSKERAPEVTYVTKVHAYFHSVKPPRAKMSTSNQTQETVSHEDKRPSSPAPETSYSEPPPGQIPTLLDDSKAMAPALEPPLLSAAEAEPPNEAPRPAPTEESIKAPSPKPSPSDAHTDQPMTHGSDTEISGSEIAPELPKQDGDILKSLTPSTPCRQAHPATATPAQADSTAATSTDTEAEHIIQPQLTPSLPNTSPPLKAEPALSPVEEARPPGANASGWHRLKKQLMVQPEAPNFPEPESEKLGQEEANKEKESSQPPIGQDCRLFKSRATRMWDAILYQMSVNKERKQQAEEKKLQKEERNFLPRRLPILLHKPRFDARKLKELAAKPMTKITTAFEVSQFRPKAAEEHSKSFNRTASGWSVS